MIRQWKSQPWVQGTLFLATCTVAIVVLLLPLGLAAESWFMPDLVFALSCAWVIRRPDTAPFYLIGAVGLLADILLGKPLGLWALLLMLGAETLRQQLRVFREYPFVIEVLWVAALLAVMLLAQQMLLFVAFVPKLPLGDLLRFFLTTVLAYPIVVAFLHWGLGVRSRTTGMATLRAGHMT